MCNRKGRGAMHFSCSTSKNSSQQSRTASKGDPPTSLLSWVYYLIINNFGMSECTKVLFTNCASDQLF